MKHDQLTKDIEYINIKCCDVSKIDHSDDNTNIYIMSDPDSTEYELLYCADCKELIAKSFIGWK